MSSSEVLPVVSNIVGWMYVALWGSYAYPQIYHTFKIKNFEGLKVDYPFLNISGFIFYAIAYSVPFFNDLPLNNYGFGTIRIQDLVFAYNGIVVNIILNIQALIYPRGKNKLSDFAIIFSIVCWLSAIGFYFASEVYGWIEITANVNILEFLGYLKISFSLIKFIPLLYWNWKRKTTQGISALAFIMNMTGASLSLIQLYIDYIDGTTITVNKIKLLLAAAVIVFDIMFLFQHFVLYGDGSKAKLQENESLLGSKYVQKGEEDA